MTETEPINKPLSKILLVLGALASTSAMISLIQRGFQVELHWGFAHFLEFYRGIFSPIVDVIQWPIRVILSALHFQWTIPQWLKDLHTLSFIGAAIFAQSARAHPTDPDWYKQHPIGAILVGYASTTIALGMFGFTFLGLAFFPMVLFGAGKSSSAQTRASFQTAQQLTLLSVLGVLIFYITNAIAPQLGFPN